MRGTIRLILGLLLVLGGVGGIEHNPEILPGLMVALLGLALMGWATYDLNQASEG
jgi:hypothetical protein